MEHLASCLGIVGNFPEALKIYDRLIAREGICAEYLLDEAELYVYLSQLEKAGELRQTALETISAEHGCDSLNYAKQQGLKGVTTETGAGQWGTALSMACSYFGLDCRVYMVKCSYEQKSFRREVMRTYGAAVTPSHSETTEVGRKILEAHPGTTGSLGIDSVRIVGLYPPPPSPEDFLVNVTVTTSLSTIPSLIAIALTVVVVVSVNAPS